MQPKIGATQESSLKTVSFRTRVGERTVTRDDIRTAMREFDMRFRLNEEDSGTLYAVQEDGKRYPPKRILGLATGVPVNKFNGGEPSNHVFRSLDFEVLKIAPHQHTWKTAKELANEKARLKLPVPRVQTLLSELFRRKWVHLHRDYSKLADSECPGVYILAYSNDDLCGKAVKENQIYYVGVSHAGVRKRLKQFIMGLEDGGHHSGAKRFYFKVANGTPYLNLQGKKTFFVSSISVPCTYLKSARNRMDLEKMGVVAGLEWCVLAEVKDKTGQEPWLNTK
jgi:hypothetical protein